MYEYKVHLLSVVSGDTVRIDIDLGFGQWLKEQTVRLAGIEAPDIQTERKDALNSRDVLESALKKSTRLTVKTTSNKQVPSAILLADGMNINDWMIENGYARICTS